MPYVHITYAAEQDLDDKRGFYKQTAQVIAKSLDIPDEHVGILLYRLQPGDMGAGGNNELRDVVHVRIELFGGRSLAVKKQLYQALSGTLANAFAVPPSHIKIMLMEIGRDDFGIGPVPASEIELGY